MNEPEFKIHGTTSRTATVTLSDDEYRRGLLLLADLINALKKHDERVLLDAGVATAPSPEPKP